MKPIEYKNFVIQLQGEGFRPGINIAGRIASFWVVRKQPQTRSIFAFAVSMLDAFEGKIDPEEEILNSATEFIKQYIDGNKVQDLEEYTFQYKSGKFISDENPKWWTKSLKTFFKI
ncbi:MAG TPA: hypothetical protein VLG12_06900 [Candidatus Saccharimonadales bacterium]|nr:hypothetical protein [Candidatus Saccharimonadales bacterium]